MKKREEQILNNISSILLTICLLMLISLFSQTTVYALTKAGNVSDGTSVKITKHTTLDTITYNGITVPAYYKPKSGNSKYNSDSTYCCAALVSRFYKQVYGITVNNLYGGRTPNASAGKFVKTTTPKVGDILGSANHWAIVKNVVGNNVYLIEQNYWWNSTTNMAGKGRIVPLKSNYHWYFHWTGIEVSKVALNKTTSTLYKGQGLQLKATLTPSNATFKTITWTTSDSSVATVNANGYVTTKDPGIATITAKAHNGKLATCKITVPFRKSVSVSAANADAGIVVSYTNVDDESGFKIYRSENNGAYKVIATTAANVLRYADTTAAPGKTYRYQVLPYRGAYLGTSSTATIYRLATPVIHSATPAFTRKITLTWGKSAGSPKQYQITYKTGNITKSIKVNVSSLKTSNGKYTYTLSGLSYAKTYQISVTAINGNYKSNVSGVKSAKVTK